ARWSGTSSTPSSVSSPTSAPQSSAPRSDTPGGWGRGWGAIKEHLPVSMISVDIGPAHFLYRVGGVCLHDGRVLLHRAVGDDFWSLPGGRCEILETAADALTREMREELAVKVTVGRLLWVVEDFFTMDGRPYHQIGLYFAVDLPD